MAVTQDDKVHDSHIAIAASAIEELQPECVRTVFLWMPLDEISATAAWIISKRPDLTDIVNKQSAKVMAEKIIERHDNPAASKEKDERQEFIFID